MGGNGMKGMNIERGREVSGQIQIRMDMVDDEIGRLEGIKSALESNWHGADSQAAITTVDEAIQLCRDLKTQLEDRKTELDQDIEEQESTSSQ